MSLTVQNQIYGGGVELGTGGSAAGQVGLVDVVNGFVRS